LEVASVARDHVGLAISRDRARRPTEAVASFREAVAAGGSDALTWWRLGVTALNGRDAEAAVAALRRAVELNPEDAEAWTDLAQALKASSDEGAATTALQRAVGVGAPAARAHHLLGAALAQRGQHGAAVKHFRRALGDDPAQIVSWRGLARSQLALGLMEDAEESFGRYRAQALQPRR